MTGVRNFSHVDNQTFFIFVTEQVMTILLVTYLKFCLIIFSFSRSTYTLSCHGVAHGLYEEVKHGFENHLILFLTQISS